MLSVKYKSEVMNGGKMYVVVQFSSVQLPSHIWLFATPWTAVRQASLSLTISQSLPKFMSIASVMPPSHLILWCSLLLLPSVFPSTRKFSNVTAVCIRWPEYWSLSFRISLSKEYSGLISLKIDWFDLIAVQESSSTPQFKSINSSELSFLYNPALTSIHDYWKKI